MKFNYQKEIDGLRAFAVIPVIFYHISEKIFPNGYLGVDLFFVISGFVITKTLLNEKNKFGEIKILNFFKRRIKRIFPALFVMVFLSMILIYMFGILNLNNFHFYAKTGLFALFGISNIFLIYKNDDYFLNQENNPFTHTWSLGVEEQFYLIYPFVLYFITKYSLSKNVFKNINIIFLIIISFSLYNFIYNDTFISNFYSPFIRIWELSLGCLAFILYSNNKNKINSNYSVVYLIIIILIFSLKLNSINYEIKTIIVVFSTFLFLLIYEDKNNFYINFFFKNTFFVYFGRISYSLYLWHLPVIYFSEIYFSNSYNFILSITITLLLAHISYKFIENPFRKTPLFDLFIFRFLKIVPFLVLIFITLLISYPSKIKINLDNFVDKVYFKTEKNNFIKKKFDLGNRLSPDYFLDNRKISKECFFEKKNYYDKNTLFPASCYKLKNKNILYIINGDCHAQHFIPMLNNSKIINNLLFVDDISLSALSKECLIYNKCNKNEVSMKKYHELTISKINDLSNEFSEIILLNKVFLTEKNNVKSLDNYEKIFDNFINKFDKKIKIIFIEPTPVFKFGPEACVVQNKECEIKEADATFDQKKISLIYNKLSNIYKNVILLNLNNNLCKNKNCVIYDKKKDFLYFKDNDNLSVEASKNLSKYFDEWVINHIDE